MNKMKNYVLPGRDPGDAIGTAVLFAVIWVLLTDLPLFYGRYYVRLKILDTESFGLDGIGDFSDITRGTLFGVVIYSLYRIIKACYDMGYFTRVTKSVYVMRRLDEKAPIVRRTWTIALIGIAAALAAALIMFVINYLIYRYYTPEAMLPSTYNIDFWGAIL